MPDGAHSIHRAISQRLDGLLRARLDPLRTEISQFGPHRSHPDNIQPAPKILLVQRGRMTYSINDSVVVLRSGSMLYRPAPSVSHWQTGSRGATIAWCEFTASSVPDEALVVHGADTALEWSSLIRTSHLMSTGEPLDKLEAEGELKALLARFYRRARPVTTEADDPVATRASPAVRRAVEYLSRHHAEPNVLRGLAEVAQLSPAHFRRVFHRQVGMSARRYLITLRLRAARYHVQYSTLPMKQIAHMVGYRDPLFFSRHYRQMFGRSPTEDRAFAPSNRANASAKPS